MLETHINTFYTLFQQKNIFIYYQKMTKTKIEKKSFQIALKMNI